MVTFPTNMYPVSGSV